MCHNSQAAAIKLDIIKKIDFFAEIYCTFSFLTVMNTNLTIAASIA